MEGPNGIEASWRFASHALRYGAGCAIHLSKLRPAGHTNDKGLVATGPVSFGKIYSALNETLRRGGAYKNGAIVLHLDLSHPDAVDFITASRSELPWVKRCIDIDDDMWKFADQDHKGCFNLWNQIRRRLAQQNQTRPNTGERIYGNVCLEVYLPSRGTCLLQHVNLGACTLDNLQEAFVSGMSELCDLHGRTGVGESGEYLTPEVDRQVGLGVLGLANFLRRYNISYEDFGEALRLVNRGHTQPPTKPVWRLLPSIKQFLKRHK